MISYDESIKKKARSLVIDRAVSTLTKNRHISTLVERNYVREVRDYLVHSDSVGSVNYASKLSDETIDRWENFYASVIQTRSPESLKIAYFSGPNPENDLREFCSHGLLPENIWAFESDGNTYLSAVSAALVSEFPFIKLFNGGIESFFDFSPQRFDIIYLDFCGPLPSRSAKTLSVITKILSKHAITSPGIIITNVSLPGEDQDPAGRSLISKLVSHYLYPKEFLESEDEEGRGDFTEGPIFESCEFDDWIKRVDGNLDNYYGQFITRVMMDLSSVIVPYNRFEMRSAFFKKLFASGDNGEMASEIDKFFHFSDDGSGGDVICDSGLYPILWTLAGLDRSLNKLDQNYPQYVNTDPEFSKFAGMFIRQLSMDGNESKFIENISRVTCLLVENDRQFNLLSERMRQIKSEHSAFKFYPFCDAVLFHQILELLFRQLAFPYHVNINETKRWKYKAKSTEMFMDMVVLDDCRYLYDWMPTTDMITSGLEDEERQLAYRFALDGVSKHSRWYNPEYFFGTAIVSQFEDGFEAKILASRENIVESI